MSELADRLVGCVDTGYGPNLDLIAKVVDTLREQDKRIEALEARLRDILEYPDLREFIGTILFDAASKTLEDKA